MGSPTPIGTQETLTGFGRLGQCGMNVDLVVLLGFQGELEKGGDNRVEIICMHEILKVNLEI